MKTNADRRVALTKVGKVEVSTVFLGIDMSWGEGTPTLYETMIFGSDRTHNLWRYATRKEAEEGHKRVVKMLIEGRPDDDE